MRKGLSTVWKGLSRKASKATEIFGKIYNPRPLPRKYFRDHPAPFEPEEISAFMAGTGNPNLMDEDDFTPLMSAVLWEGPALIEALLKAGANVNAAGGYYRWTPLTLAAVRGDMAVLSAVLAGRPDVLAETIDGQNALQHALVKENRAFSQLIRDEAARQAATVEAGPFRKMRPIVFAKK